MMQGDNGAYTATLQSTTTELEIPPGHRALIPLGFRARLPLGMEGQIRLRSSFALESGLVIPNAPGTIDADFPGEWVVLLSNLTAATATVRHGKRFAQVVFAAFSAPTMRPGKVKQWTQRKGGLGSTGREGYGRRNV